MPLMLVGLAGLFFGTQIDNAVNSFFNRNTQSTGLDVTKIAITGALIVFTGLGVKKLLK